MSRLLTNRLVHERALPVVFVLLWSTGFIGARMGMPYAEPFTFLAWRFVLVAALLLVVVLLTRAPWPASRTEIAHIAVSGILIQGIYLGGVFAAIDQGLGTGVAAVIVGTQPLVTAMLVGVTLGERVSPRQWSGLALGFAGVTLVLWETIDFAGADRLGVTLATAALLAISVGTIYQKRYCSHMSLRSGSLIQYCAASLLMVVLASALETGEITWTGEFVFALAWLIIVLSVGAVTLLWVLIRRGAAAKVASLFYLIPPAVALESYLLFDERLAPLAIFGILVTALGVALASR